MEQIPQRRRGGFARPLNMKTSEKPVKVLPNNIVCVNSSFLWRPRSAQPFEANLAAAAELSQLSAAKALSAACNPQTDFVGGWTFAPP